MSKMFNLNLQGVLIFLQGLNYFTLPAKIQIYVALGVGVLQAVISWRAHYFNPDGTPAESAYRAA